MDTTTQMDRINLLGADDLKKFINSEATDAELMDYWGKHAASVRDFAAAKEAASKKGDSLIVLLPGVMGSTLEDKGDFPQLLWINPLAYVRGQINRLDLDLDGMQPASRGVNVQVRGLMWIVYAKMLLALQANHEIVTFPYDWRLATWSVVGNLKRFIDDQLAKSQFNKVTLVGHSLGGLLAMDYVTDPTTCDHAEKVVKRVITLGTPFRGALPAVTFLARGGQDDIKLKIIEGLNSQNNVLQMLRTFPSMYQILPAPKGLYDGWDPIPGSDIWNPITWSQLEVPINVMHLQRALEHHKRLAAADPQVDVYCVAGALYNTPFGLDGDLLRGMLKRAWDGADSGDGTVATLSAKFRGRPTYYVYEIHTELVLERTIIDAIVDWVEEREPIRLVSRLEDVVRLDMPMRGVLSVEGQAFVSPDEIARKAQQDIPLAHEELRTLASVM